MMYWGTRQINRDKKGVNFECEKKYLKNTNLI